MKSAALVDSDVLIDFTRKLEESIALLRRLETDGKVMVSDISRMELFVGARNKQELSQIEKSLQRFTPLPLNEAISHRAVELIKAYRLSHGLLIADALIAASALMWDIPLATKNRRDFQFIDGLRLLDWQV